MVRGYWCPVLHAHLPFVRHPEHDDFLEEDWLYEGLTETYVPLLALLDRLAADGVEFRLTLTLSPTLVAMLRDELLVSRYRRHLDRLRALAERERQRTARQGAALAASARLYAETFRNVQEVFESYGGDVLRGFARHAASGRLEILASAATHACLPLLDTVPPAVRAQVRVGVDHHARHLGRPSGFWLPECAYAPGHDAGLREAGIRYSFVDGHGLMDADPSPTAGRRAPIVSPGGVVFFGRDPESSRQIWSAEVGYPGDPLYREFYRDIGWELPLPRLGEAVPGRRRKNVGVKYHRVTGKVPLNAKQLYDPAPARARAAEHAAHFVAERCRQVAREASGLDHPSLVVSAFDAELFGHWWFEGLTFLEEVFRLLSAQECVQPVTPLEYLDRHPDCEVAEPAASSWGAEGYVDVWLDPSNDWMYPELETAAERMVELARRYPRPDELQGRALRQAARELLLAQSSDWAFLIKTGTAVDYASRRFLDHIDRFARLHDALREGGLAEDRLREIERQDNLFPDLDYRVYR
jgi:1,4-alpha-glucan branching enzyme